eukprot:jgi/Astpho2/7510/Aster-02076
MGCSHDALQDGSIFSTASPSGLREVSPEGTVLAYDERMLLHRDESARGSPHPERPDRIKAVMARLERAGLTDQCTLLPAREVSEREVLSCHTPELVAKVAAKAAIAAQLVEEGFPGMAHMNGDTYVNPHSYLCARLAAGGCADVAAAVAAGARKVLILDWDVHHGNGTQHIFEDDSDVMYMSLHRHDLILCLVGSFYPGTGAANECGEGPGEGFTVNVPWQCGGMGNGDYVAAFQHVLLPIAMEFNPDLIIASAGYDAAEGDPLGACHVTTECYAWMTEQLQAVAPLVVLLEGGYNLSITAASTEACMRVLLGQRAPRLPEHRRTPSLAGMAVIQHVVRVQARYWKCLQGLQAHIPLITRPLPGPAHPGSAEAAAEPQDDEVSDVRDDDEDQASGDSDEADEAHQRPGSAVLSALTGESPSDSGDVDYAPGDESAEDGPAELRAPSPEREAAPAAALPPPATLRAVLSDPSRPAPGAVLLPSLQQRQGGLATPAGPSSLPPKRSAATEQAPCSAQMDK